MKKNRILSMVSASLLLLCGACSDDTLNSGSTDNLGSNPEDGVYLTVNFDMPVAKDTRSFTNGDNSSNSGTEIGQDYENAVSSVAIVIADPNDYSYIVSATTNTSSVTIKPVGSSGTSYQSTSKFTKTDLDLYYQGNNFVKDPTTGNNIIAVFVFCNPNTALMKALDDAKYGDKDWMNTKGKFDESLPDALGNESPWKEGAFLMSNSAIATRLFPTDLADWDNYSTESNPFNLSGLNSFGRPNEIDNYTGKGNVRVERVSARYDFRDGALDGIGNPDKTYNGFKAQTYHVVLDSEENPLVDVFLGKMSMVNMNKEYYYLRRVSSNGLDKDATLCGVEAPWYTNATGGGNLQGNYVVDAFAEWKNGYDKEGAQRGDIFANLFNFPFFNQEGEVDNTGQDRWYTETIEKVLDNTKDNTEGWLPNDGNHKSYRIWRYLTEGTIPGITAQKNAISNGVVFKGLLQPAREAKETDDEYTKLLLNSLKTAPKETDGNGLSDPILYLFSGHVYCTWEAIRSTALSYAVTNLKWEGDAETGKWTYTINRSSTLYNAVFGTGGFGEISFTANIKDAEDNIIGTEKVTLKDDLAPANDCPNTIYNTWASNKEDIDKFAEFQKAAVKANITIYQRSYDKELGGWGYYCYYYYWNRHNDNGQNGVMGPMEFAVVRNNVYKLAVTKISRLGHPRVGSNDPDKPTPNTPDEKFDVYITVTCTTLPWVVRENNIEF